jgi:hypothetical protein
MLGSGAARGKTQAMERENQGSNGRCVRQGARRGGGLPRGFV